ncbi:MAG: carbohydrate kinase family protein [Gammaproteobacteria bacterium]
MHPITLFGEVLFDCFPSGEKVLGGAPFNVAWHLQAFGQAPHFISRIGDDPSGGQIHEAMKAWGMATESLQMDHQHPTGEVRISLQGGEPSYDIVSGVAYDFIDAAEIDDQPCTLLYHGTLAVRNEVSRKALERLKAKHPSTVFMDVNLRDPWWQRDRVLGYLDQADWVKLNDEEFTLLFPNSGDLLTSARSFLARHGLRGLVVTRAEKGALAVVADQPPVEVAPHRKLEVVDTVGAGDGFAAVLLLGLNLNWPIRTTLERASDFASALVGRRGAIVKDPLFYQPFRDSWNLQ